jgi:hypothetical protein
MNQRMKEVGIMKTVLAGLLGLSLMTGIASQASAATRPALQTANVHVAAADYDDPDFGSEPWWDEEEDRGG